MTRMNRRNDGALSYLRAFFDLVTFSIVAAVINL